MNSATTHLTQEGFPWSVLPSERHIRILELQPGNRDASIHCRLLTTTIDEAPAYEALSYVWGSQINLVSITVQANSSKTCYKHMITANCHSALKRLRYEDCPRVLWIDALCIDQTNIAERNHQITLMSRIYSEAAEVLIYLGEDTADSAFAINVISGYDDPKMEKDPIDITKVLTDYQRDSNTKVQALNNLFHRPWFHRVWVIQEAAFARKAKVICGTSTCDWSSVRHFRHWANCRSGMAPLPFVVRAEKLGLEENSFLGVSRSILAAMDQARLCHATIPHDKIYALLPFLNFAELELNIVPNYHDSVIDLFAQIAAGFVAKCGYSLLKAAAQGPRELTGLASWVPDWTIPSTRMPLSPMPLSAIALHGAYSGPYDTQARHLHAIYTEGDDSSSLLSKQKPQLTRISGFMNSLYTHIVRSTQAITEAVVVAGGDEAKTSGDGKQKLRLQGRGESIGQIAKVGSVYLAHEGPFPLHERRLISNEAGRGSEFKSEKLHDFLHVVTCGEAGNFGIILDIESWVSREDERNAEQSVVKSWGQSVKDLAMERKEQNGPHCNMMPFENIPFADAPYGIFGTAEKMVRNMLQCCHYRRFFITDTGYMGLGPAETRVGDKTYRCVGADVPFVFRKAQQTGQDDHHKLFTLVGECFMNVTIAEQTNYKNLEAGVPIASEAAEYFYII
jgi:hypothetical protein